jgi:hypothetical protein
VAKEDAPVRKILFALTLFPAVLLSASPAQNAPEASPNDVKLTVVIRRGQSTFRTGELIPLDLSFTSTALGQYQFDNASYDRSGRLNLDTFNVEPKSGWDDPLDAYFHSFQVFMGGGLRGASVLSTHPTIIHFDLNEWIRFKTPGHHRITITSGRVSRIRGPDGGRAVSVTSNTIAVSIVPATREWQAATLKATVAALDGMQATSGASTGALGPQEQAVKVLRYLGSAGAARELARHLTGTKWDWDFTAGLVGSPAKDTALEEMKRLVDPDFPVTDRFLTAMSVIEVSDDAGDARPAERDEAEQQFRQLLTSAIDGKRGWARAVSVKSIVEEAAIHSRGLPPDLRRKLTRELIADFDKLPLEKQAELIQFRWPALDHEEMLPLIRTIARRYRDFPELREIVAYEFNNMSGAALKHWYEMEPEEARPVVIQEIIRPKPRFGSSVLGILPDKSLPEVESVLVDHLRGEYQFDVNGNIASLIARYATPAIEGRVTGYLDPMLGKMACSVQEPLLAYILRVDPEGARPRIESAMAARGQGFSACNHMLLPEIAKLQNDKILEDVATKALEDSDPQIVQSAATYLEKYGSAAAEDLLWARFVTWSTNWKGHESELQYALSQPMDGVYQAGAGSSLMQALATGQAWLADETKLRRLIDLSVGTQQKQQAEQYLNQLRTRPWTILFIPSGDGEFRIAKYDESSLAAAKEKLGQFPRGSSFVWPGSRSEAGEQTAFDELSRFAGDNGLRLSAQSR